MAGALSRRGMTHQPQRGGGNDERSGSHPPRPRRVRPAVLTVAALGLWSTQGEAAVPPRVTDFVVSPVPFSPGPLQVTLRFKSAKRRRGSARGAEGIADSSGCLRYRVVIAAGQPEGAQASEWRRLPPLGHHGRASATQRIDFQVVDAPPERV